MRRFWWLLLPAVGVFGCAGQRELPPGAMGVGRAAEPESQSFAVDGLGGFLGLGYFLTADEQRGSGGLDRNENILQERAGLGLEGNVLSPEFLTYEGTGVFGLTQDWARGQGVDEFDSGEIREADASLDFFEERFHPASVYYSRVESIQPQVFFSSAKNITETARASQRLIGDDFRLSLDGDYRDIHQERLGGPDERSLVDVTVKSAGATADYDLTRYQNLSGSYRYEVVRQADAENDFNAHRVLGQHRWYLDEDRDHELASRFEGVDQDGATDQQLVRVNENLRSRLLDSLRADARFKYEDNDTNVVDLREISGEGGLTHQLYRSLTTSVSFNGGRQETNGESTVDILGGNLSLNYNKTTPVGMLRAQYANSMERRVTTNSQGGAVDEAHTFPTTPPEEVRLVNVGVDVQTIVVTDPTGLIFYREGPDYTVRQDGSSITTISRVFTGNIPFGGSILVDYQFLLRADFTLDTVFHIARLEHEFTGGLTPYFRFEDQQQGVSDLRGPGGIVPIKERSVIGGLEWRLPSYLVGAEYENQESNVLPFNAFRMFAEGQWTRDRQSLTGNLTQSWLFYRNPERDVAITQMIAYWTGTITRDLYLRFDAAFRYDDDSLQGYGSAYSFTGEVEYVWRSLSLRVRGGYRETNSSSSQFRGLELGLYVVREFGRPPRSTRVASDRFLRQ